MTGTEARATGLISLSSLCGWRINSQGYQIFVGVSTLAQWDVIAGLGWIYCSRSVLKSVTEKDW